jgi:hypothetical protein
MNNYKIKISCTKKEDLCYNNEKLTKTNYNKQNLENLINNTDYIEKSLFLYKTIKKEPKYIPTIKIKPKYISTTTLEFICKCDNEISDIDFETFIKDMKNIGFSSNTKNTIHLIKINGNNQNETIFTYKFKSITKQKIIKKKHNPNRSTYHTQMLYTK